ncbi:MAG: glycosyltransferase family 39 protein [Acidobacteriota bacterium]
MKRGDLAALSLILLSLLRIASTWTVFSATVDEPMHISAGLELYSRHVYEYQPENPPLPRLVLALAPYLGGMTFDPAPDKIPQLLGVFSANGHYERNLVLARSGNLFFFALAALATWLWSRRELGAAGGCVATLLFTMQPIVLGYSGVATHDAAATAGLALSLLAFARWLEVSELPARAAAPRAIAAGAAFGFAVLCKFSCIGYVPAACGAMFAIRWIGRRRRMPGAPSPTGVQDARGSLLVSLAAATLSAVLAIGLGYGFHYEIFLAGVRGLAEIGRAGTHFGYLFGELSTKGWWYYFPVAVGLKSTLASLMLALAALVVVRHQRVAGEALGAAAAILLVAMPSSLDLGVRYVLPLYVPLSVAAAAAAVSLRPRWIAIVLLAWHTGASLLAQPDNLPYFNEAAGPRPWQLLADSNIDWGQDVLRLRRALAEKKADRVGLAIFGWHRWNDLHFPPHYDAYPTLPTQGWVAVSEHLFQIKNFTWLRGRKYERVGKSIRLYYIP